MVRIHLSEPDFLDKNNSSKTSAAVLSAEVLALSDSKEPRFEPRSEQLRFKTFAECDLGHPRLEPTLS